MSPTSWNRPIVEKGCIYNLSFFFFFFFFFRVCVVDGGHFPKSKLKMGSRHQNLISSCPCVNNIAVQVWSKSIHSFWR